MKSILSWTPSRWTVPGAIVRRRWTIDIERREQPHGPALFRITSEGSSLNTDFQWEIEASPSGRDATFDARCRFPSLEAATEHFAKYVVRFQSKPTGHKYR